MNLTTTVKQIRSLVLQAKENSSFYDRRLRTLLLLLLITEKRRSARFRRRTFSSRDLKDLHDGKEIYETLTQASDPDSVKVSVPVMLSVFTYNHLVNKSAI